MKEQHKLSFAQVVTNGKGRTNEGASWFNVKVELSSWLDICFVGRLLEVPNMQLVKESFILDGFSVVRLRYLKEKQVLLSCDEDGLIGKIIVDNKEWFASMFDSILP